MFPVQCGVLPALEAFSLGSLCLPFSIPTVGNLREAPNTGTGWELTTLMPAHGADGLEGGCQMDAHRSPPLPRLPGSLALCKDARLGVSG